MNRSDDLETVELLMEKNIISNNHYYVNDINEFNYHSISKIQIYENNLLYSFSEIFDKYINKTFQNSNYNTIINDLIDGKIVVRDKNLIKILNILKIFKYNEDHRMKFIEKLKNMDCQKILKDIDNSYDKIYNEYNLKSSNYNINLDEIGIPHYCTYNYLMTFEKNHCSLHIENNDLFLYYYLENESKNNIFYNCIKNKNCLKKNEIKEFKINLSIVNKDTKYGIRVDVNKKKVLIPYIKDDNLEKENILFCLLNKVYNNFDNREILNTEHKYIESIFRYHNINIFNYLSEKYVNYKFEIHYNYKHELDNENKKINKSYVSLYIY